jgi:immunoglobulin-binding protein 1
MTNVCLPSQNCASLSCACKPEFKHRTIGLLQDCSLPQLFSHVQKAIEGLESTDKGSLKDTAQLITELLRRLRKAALLIDSLGLFSPNEDLDDVAGADIKYLLVPYYHADLIQRRPLTSLRRRQSLQFLNERLGALNEAQKLYELFIHKAEQYSLSTPSPEEVCAGSLKNGKLDQKKNSQQAREEKIRRFKLRKSLQIQFDAMSMSGYLSADPEQRETQEREYYELKIRLAALDSYEKLTVLKQEIEVLSHAVDNYYDENEKEGKNGTEKEDSMDNLRDQLGQAADTLRMSFNQRQRLENEVLRPSHILPTITVEEFGTMELAAAERKNRRNGQREVERQVALASLSKEDKDTMELARQRTWDDWKDVNPRGWGNSKLRPCG